jgi:aminoglycoside/choline kinase family phosphotransferase
LLAAAFVITRGIPDTVDLRRYAREVWWGLPRDERRRIYDRIRARIFTDLRRIHRANFFHQDLHWRNILVNPERIDTEPPVWIDCPRAAYRRWGRRHGELGDLSCLARGALTFLTPGQRLRALREYLENDAGPGRAGEARALYRAIAAHHRRSRHPPRVEKLGCRTR